MKTRLLACVVLLLATTIANADPDVTVRPTTARAGDAVLVTVRGAKATPKGEAAGKALQFAKTKAGYQAVFAVPLALKADDMAIAIDGAAPVTVALRVRTFPETNVTVEDELANPPAAERQFVDADNAAIIAAMAKPVDVKLVRAFKRPSGEVTSQFGEWRTFNDGHRSQHLGLDLFAKEGANVRAVNAGIVTLVRDTYLAGNVVVVSHGRGIASAYFHLSETKVAEGDAISANTIIGLVGQTGRATGPHLHLSIHVPGGMVDPASFFKLAISP